MRQTLTRSGLTASHEVAYPIGSGSHARGFLIRIGGALFQSPVAEYPRARRWDVAPGYESMTHPDFNRAVSSECLFCHASGNAGAPSAIGCERCHGDPARHLSEPRKGTIVNPARLNAIARDSVCEQCHLAGEARIPNPGRALEDFQPGAPLEDFAATFIYDRPRADLRVISHVEQLALSRCVPKLACTTCHSPHGSPVDVNGRCLSCHAGARSESHPKGAGCAGCHMPKRPASDGAHTAFTDHRIARWRNEPKPGPTTLNLKPWREPSAAPVARRNRGLALIAIGERDRNQALIQQGYQELRAVFPAFEKDSSVLAAIGMVLFLQDRHADAAKLLQAAIAQSPRDAGLHEKLAVVLRAQGAKANAAAALEKAIALEPARESAYHLLQEIRPESNALDRYLVVNPQSLIAREAKRRLTR